MTVKLFCGDSVEVMRTLPAASVDSIVTDPPYGLSEHRHADVVACLTAWLKGEEFKPNKRGFMGRAWDAWVPGPEVFREALRVAKPGAHMLVFAGTRSMDLMMMAIRLAGWEIRDAIGDATDPGDTTQPGLMAWVYGSGFPKNRDLAKMDFEGEDAQKWAGWGTALKPAWEPVIIARKPLQGTVAANVLKHGTGAYNIDACRIETDEDLNGGAYAEVGGRKVSGSLHAGSGMNQAGKTTGREFVQPTGRWPANVIHDGSEVVLACFPDAPGARGDITGDEPSTATANVMNARARVAYTRREDLGTSAARFFYCPKTSSADRHEGLEHPGAQFAHGSLLREARELKGKGNSHPTVKPTELMRYFVRLVTRPGGTVLDFCMGSGSTGKAAELEGMDFIGIDIDPHWVGVADQRIGADAPLFREAA